MTSIGIRPDVLVALGALPIRTPPLRFAVGHPDGYSSNAWRVWTNVGGDAYIACRDNFSEAKVSLHRSGRWRMGFTSEALKTNEWLLALDENRAWEVWDRPPTPVVGAAVPVFKLLFPSSSLLLRPDQRDNKLWRDVIFVEPAPRGLIACATLVITATDIDVAAAGQSSARIACFKYAEEFLQVVVHGEPEGDLADLLQRHVNAQLDAVSGRVEVPEGAVCYMWGARASGERFIVCNAAAKAPAIGPEPTIVRVAIAPGKDRESSEQPLD